MQDSINVAVDSDIKYSILHSLAYSAVFNYPLSQSEIIVGMDSLVDDTADIRVELENLVASNTVLTNGSFYSLKENPDGFKLREARNKRAKKYLPLAKVISRFMGNFPFVRAVFISGSLSKNSLDNDGDIDYFIITEPGRLWICRTLLIIFKKIFLFNSYKFFCLNYFIDSNGLEIEDRNIYTAHEIATLIPTYGRKTCIEFFSANPWIKDYLPNSITPSLDATPAARIWGLKWLMEKILKTALADGLERKFKNYSEYHWKKKHKDLNQKELDITLVLRDNKSTYHPQNFKYKVLDKFDELKKELIAF